MSSSVWGCGLKSIFRLRTKIFSIVILRVRMWIEINVAKANETARKSHPPCEDVDWNFVIFPASVASNSHPPCEDVDWNTNLCVGLRYRCRSSSVWGCGLKCRTRIPQRPFFRVILRVRMWIEITRSALALAVRVGHPPCEDVDWNALVIEVFCNTYQVIFHVRMWIEIAPYACSQTRRRRHPLREGVDWNQLTAVAISVFDVSPSVRRLFLYFCMYHDCGLYIL